MQRPPGHPSPVPTSSSLTPKTKMVRQRCQGGSGFKLRKLNDDVEENNAVQIESNITHAQENNLVSEPKTTLVRQTTEPTTEEETKKMSAKDQLYKLCGVRHWNAPVYECCNDEAPNSIGLFTVKAKITIKEDSQITEIECFGGPQQKKKIAAEQAAEAALWYLENVGYTLQTDKASGRRKQKKRAAKHEKITVTGAQCNDHN